MQALIAALLLVPLPALADPVSIFAAVASVASAVGMTVPTLAAVTIAVANVGYQVYGASSARRKARKEAARQRAEYNASLQDRSITTLTANPPWRVIYGRCITGGDIVAIFTSDKTATREDGSSYTKPDALKHLVVVLAAHQCQAIHEVYIDGVALGALDGNGWVTTGEFYKSGQPTRQVRTIAAGGTYNAGSAVTLLGAYAYTGAGADPWVTNATVTLTSGNTIINNGNSYSVTVEFTVAASNARVRVSKALGTDSQTVDTYLNSVVPSQWDSNCRLRGLTYCVVTLDLEETRFQGGPPNLTFDVSGKLIYDTRTATTAWSQNPALIIRDFLMSQWGYQCASTDIDTTLCNAAANACDALITLNVGGVTTANQPKYTCNGAFSTADSREAILEDLCESMAGFATYGATWGIVAGVWTASVMTLTDDDLDGQIEVVQAGAGMDGIFNGVRGQYITVDKSTPSDFDSYQNSTFVTADGQALWSDLTLPFTNNKYRARNLARIFVERARQGLVIRYPAKLRAWPLQIGDRVTVNSTEYGFSSKTFRVTDWQFGASTAVQLTLQEDVASVYDLADAATADPAPNTALPNPWVVAAVTNVTATSSTSTMLISEGQGVIPRVLVSWSALTDAYIVNAGGYVDVAWLRPGGQWVQQSVPGDQTSVYITGPAHGEPIVIRVNARNSLQAIGPFVYVYHTVSGRLAPAAGQNMFWPAQQYSVPGGTYGLNTGLTHAAANGYFRYGGVDLGGYGLQPGEVITLSADVWCDATCAAAGQYSTLFVYTSDSGGNWIVSRQLDGTTTTATRKSTTFTLPATASMVNIGIGLYHQGTNASTSPAGTVYADRIQVERGPVATAYAPATALGSINTSQLAISAATDVTEYEDLTDYTLQAGGTTSVELSGNFTYPFDVDVILTATATAQITSGSGTAPALSITGLTQNPTTNYQSPFAYLYGTTKQTLITTTSFTVAAGKTVYWGSTMQYGNGFVTTCYEVHTRVEVIKR